MEQDRLESDLILVEIKGHVAVVTLNRPAKHNALNEEMAGQLKALLRELSGRDELRVIILRANGPSFSAGHDMTELVGRQKGESDAVSVSMELERARGGFQEWFGLLRQIRQPIIAAVQGHCVNYGLELAMNCDVVLASDDAQFLSRPLGGTRAFFHLWPWLVGMRAARELIYLRRGVTAAEAARLGMINRIVPAADLALEAEDLANEIAATPLEFLALEKQALNRVGESMGMLMGIAASADIAGLAHLAPEARTFREVSGERGWKAGVSQLGAQSAND